MVVSPHLDDGVLSLGASIAAWRRAGATVGLLTVFGCDPASDAPTGGWDRRAGFATEGESARARREEDRRACATVGAEPVWLSFGSVDYDRHGDEDDVRRAVRDAVAGADLVLLPGFPLSHPDHEWLAQTLAAGPPAARVGLYAEQPYTRRVGRDPQSFRRVATQLQDRLAKWRAIRCYRSQLPLLGMRRSMRGGAHRYAFAPELVAWGED